MTIQEYKQQLYDACKEHLTLAQMALDRFAKAETEQEKNNAKIDNLKHICAYNALQWALDKINRYKLNGYKVRGWSNGK